MLALLGAAKSLIWNFFNGQNLGKKQKQKLLEVYLLISLLGLFINSQNIIEPKFIVGESEVQKQDLECSLGSGKFCGKKRRWKYRVKSRVVF